jgi:hypothetical protein
MKDETTRSDVENAVKQAESASDTGVCPTCGRKYGGSTNSGSVGGGAGAGGGG